MASKLRVFQGTLCRQPEKGSHNQRRGTFDFFTGNLAAFVVLERFFNPAVGNQPQ